MAHENVDVIQSKELPQILADIKDNVKNMSDSQSEEKVKREKMEADIRTFMESQKQETDLIKAKVFRETEEEEAQTKAIFDSLELGLQTDVAKMWGYNHPNEISKSMYTPTTQFQPGRGVIKTGTYELPEHVMRMNDALVLWGAMKCIKEHNGFNEAGYKRFVLESDTYKILKGELGSVPGIGNKLFKALNTGTTTEGGDWVPTQMSSLFIDEYRTLLKVAALFARINMPNKSGSFDVPLLTTRANAYLVSESTTDTSDKYPTSDPVTGKVTFTAIKHAVRTLFSDEVEEDSMVAMMPLVTTQLLQALADAEENACINGDSTDATHFDTDVTTATDVEKSWDGLRYAGGTATGAHPTGNAAVDISTLTTATLRSIRQKMGKYGNNPNDLAWTTGYSGFIQMLSLDEVETMDKFGPAATIKNGVLGMFDGAPVVVSEYVKQTLNTNGYYDGSTKTDTLIMCVNHRSFWFGDKTSPRAESGRIIETGQTKVVTSVRKDFKKVYTPAATEGVVGIGYSLTS